MSAWSEEEITTVVQKICASAAEDAAYHARALAEPHAVIKEVSGKDVPEGMQVRFTALEGADLCFVLPDPQQDGELSDADLESVAGGRCQISSVSIGYCR